MKKILLAFATACTLAACQSSPSKPKLPADVPAEENAAPKADTTSNL